MHQSVNQGDHTGGIGKDFILFCEGAVGGHHGRVLFISPIDDLKQQIGMAVAVGEVTDFINDQ